MNNETEVGFTAPPKALLLTSFLVVNSTLECRPNHA